MKTSTNNHTENFKEKTLRIGLPSEPSQWAGATAKFSEGSLHILGHQVMNDWASPYMKMLAEITTRNGGRVLEIGFGLGISAKYIQKHDIEEHLIIEANHDVFVKLREFAQQSPCKTIPLEGTWQDIVSTLPEASFDGILFDPYPITEDDLTDYNYVFFRHAFRLLRTNGIFTYFSSEVDSFSQYHRQRLSEAGFRKIESMLCAVSPSEDSSWFHPTILAPVVTKS